MTAVRNIIMIGSSTGGLKVLEQLMPRLSILKASVVLIQHITPHIDAAFASSLQRVSSMPIILAKEGDRLQEGVVHLAPGAVHLYLTQQQTIHLASGEKVNSVCPSIDVAMMSVKPMPGVRLCSVILTGMGCDGTAGLVHLKSLGAVTIAQDQKSSVIYGMPKAAAETGKVDHILSTERIGDKLKELFG